MSYEFAFLLLAWAVAGGSPGPATLAISGTAMAQGRAAAVTLAAGVVLGSASWGIAAGFGLSALMLANAWVFEVLRYAGAAYLAFLALKALRSAWVGGAAPTPAAHRQSRLFVKGLALHLTNPKAIVSWAAVYTVALPPDATVTALWSVFGALICVSMVVFFGYALLFSSERIAQGYAKARRVFEAVFGGMFGAAAVKIFTAKLPVQQ